MMMMIKVLLAIPITNFHVYQAQVTTSTQKHICLVQKAFYDHNINIDHYLIYHHTTPH